MSRKGTPSINASTDARVVAKPACAVKVENPVSAVENSIKNASRSRSRSGCAPMSHRPCSSYVLAKRTSVPSWLVRTVEGIIKRCVGVPLELWLTRGIFLFSQCDDQRPCSRCVVRGEECVHVGRGPKLVKLRCEGCRQENRKCEDARPCKQCIEQGRECVSVQRKGRGHGTRVKAVSSFCPLFSNRCDLHRCRRVRHAGEDFDGFEESCLRSRSRRDKVRCDGVR